MNLAVPIMPSVHGTDFDIAEKIMQTGFATISILDAGYFGKGIYFSTYMLYCLPYCSIKKTPAVIISYLNMGNVFPVTEHHKGDNNLSGAAISTGYNSHYVRTTKDGNCFRPTEAQLQLMQNNGLEPKYLCDELVLQLESQILPAFILKLDKKAVKLECKNWNRETTPERRFLFDSLKIEEKLANSTESLAVGSSTLTLDNICIESSVEDNEFRSDLTGVKEYKGPFSLLPRGNQENV